MSVREEGRVKERERELQSGLLVPVSLEWLYGQYSPRNTSQLSKDFCALNTFARLDFQSSRYFLLIRIKEKVFLFNP